MNLYTMKHILVCSDLSPESDTVLKSAELLSKKNQATLDVLYVSELGLHVEETLRSDSSSTYRYVFLQDLRKSINSKIVKQMERVNLSANVIIKSGDVSEEILKLANEGNHDLIIMGHGRKNIFEKLLGSNATKVVSRCPVPLLIVKRLPEFGKVGCLIDESRAMDKQILGAFNFASHFGYDETEFIALWIDFPKPFGNTEEGHKVQDRIEDEVKYFAPQNARISFKVAPTRELNLADPLAKILREDHVDTAVLKKFNEGNLKRVYIGSTTKKLLENFEGNLLVIPPEQ